MTGLPNGFKAEVHARFVQLCDDAVEAFRERVAALAEDAQTDAKSSAGDKHETALSHMHIEQEKATAKMREWIAHRRILEQLDPGATMARIGPGSLVELNGSMWLYFSSALPKISVKGRTVIGLSANAPLASDLLGRVTGDVFERNGSVFTVTFFC